MPSESKTISFYHDIPQTVLRTNVVLHFSPHSQKCMPEIDDYMNCIPSRLWTIGECKKYALVMRRCLLEFETPENIGKQRRRLLLERINAGCSLLRSQDRAKYNRLFSTNDDWLEIPSEAMKKYLSGEMARVG